MGGNLVKRGYCKIKAKKTTWKAEAPALALSFVLTLKMFKNLFGGGKKPEKKEAAVTTPSPAVINLISQTSIDFEKVTHQVMKQELIFEEKIEKYTKQIEEHRKEAKEFIR